MRTGPRASQAAIASAAATPTGRARARTNSPGVRWPPRRRLPRAKSEAASGVWPCRTARTDDTPAATKSALIPPMGNFQAQWINACKGNLKTSCDFDYGGKMIEMMLLGLVAYRAGRKISYDGAKGKVTDSPEADALLRRTYRQGWTLNG